MHENGCKILQLITPSFIINFINHGFNILICHLLLLYFGMKIHYEGLLAMPLKLGTNISG